MSTDEELLLLAAATLAATISLVAFSSNLALTVNMITSQLHKYVNTSTTSRDSTKRCHWLQHICLMDIFHTFESLQLLHAGVATRCIQ